jgi:ribosomal protein S18 acetylase RimI-like enzyme
MKNSSSALHIRPARREDAPALVDLLMRTYETTWMPQMSAQADSRFRASGKTAAYVAERGLRFHVCELDGTVAGMVDWEGNFIWALHVQPGMQRRGVGAALLALAEAGMRQAGVREARLETDDFNVSSRAFYARNGYQEIDTYPDEEWDSGFTTVLLSKQLAD